MMKDFTGSCLCGAVRYVCSAEPTANCHCRDCQRATGSAFAAALLVPESAVTITGEVKYHDVTGNSGGVVSRGFCPICGARLFGKSALPELRNVSLNLLWALESALTGEPWQKVARLHSTRLLLELDDHERNAKHSGQPDARSAGPPQTNRLARAGCLHNEIDRRDGAKG